MFDGLNNKEAKLEFFLGIFCLLGGDDCLDRLIDMIESARKANVFEELVLREMESEILPFIPITPFRANPGLGAMKQEWHKVCEVAS